MLVEIDRFAIKYRWLVFAPTRGIAVLSAQVWVRAASLVQKSWCSGLRTWKHWCSFVNFIFINIVQAGMMRVSAP